MTNPIQGWPYGIDGRAAINLTTDRRETTRELIAARLLARWVEEGYAGNVEDLPYEGQCEQIAEWVVDLFADVVVERGDALAGALVETERERDKAEAALAKQVEETMEVATELAEARTTADEMTRAVKRLVDERDDARAEAKGARSDYRELKGINADLADERDGLRRLLAQIRLLESINRHGWLS